MRIAKDFSRMQTLEFARRYTELSDEAARTFFCEENDISSSTYYNLLYSAVWRCIANDAIVEKICQKAARNAEKNAGENAKLRTIKNYNRLKLKRKAFKLPKKEGREAIEKYADSSFTKEQFCDLYPMTIELFDRTAVDQIVNNKISDEYVKKLQSKAMARYNDERTIQFFKGLIEQRNQNQK